MTTEVMTLGLFPWLTHNLKGRNYTRFPKSTKIKALFLLLLLITTTSGLSDWSIPIEGAGENWLTGWSYRQGKVLLNSTGAGTDYTVEFKVYYDSDPSLFDSLQKVQELTVPYYGAGGALHPDVLYFPDGQDGYEFWMVYTPYPPGTDEEPSIVRSNDGVTWTGTGISNPVIPRGADAEIADPDFLYISEYSTWFMVYTRDNATRKTVHLATSTNGTTWTENCELIDGSKTYEKDDGAVPWTREPTMIFEDDWFYIWYDVLNSTADVNNKRWTCLAKFQWNDGTDTVYNFARDASNPLFRQAADATYSIGQGHISVSEHNGVYNMYGLRWITALPGRYDMLLWNSTDKTTWNYQGLVLEHGGTGDWDEQYIYRGGPVTDGEGSIILISDKLMFHYSGAPLGLAEPDMGLAYSVNGGLNLNGLSETDFGDIRFTDDDGETELDYVLIEKADSSHATFWVEVSDNLNSTDATIYIYYGNAGATTTSDLDATFPLADDFNDASLDTAKWTAFKNGSANAIVNEIASGGGTLQLAGEALVTSSGNLRSDSTFTYDFEIRLVHSTTEEHYTTSSMGGTDPQDEAGGGANWWQTVMGDGYSYFWQSPVSGETVAAPHDVSLRESADGGAIANLATLDKGGLTTLNANHTLRMQYFSDGLLRWYHDNLLWLSATDVTYLNNAKYVLLSQGEHGPSGNGGNRFIDWVFIRKCVNPEPIHEVWGAVETPPPPSNTAPERGAYTLSDFDAPDLYSDGERNTRFWFTATDADGYDTIDTHEFAIQIGATWCNFSYDAQVGGDGAYTKTTEQPYVEIFDDGWAGIGTSYTMFSWIQVNPGTPDTYDVTVYQRVTDTSAATSGWGTILGNSFNFVEPPDDGSTSGGSSSPPSDEDDELPIYTEPTTPPGDTDGDGIPDDVDPDIDGDGIPNLRDTDMDGDGIPNNEDPDLDGDGVPNSSDWGPYDPSDRRSGAETYGIQIGRSIYAIESIWIRQNGSSVIILLIVFAFLMWTQDDETKLTPKKKKRANGKSLLERLNK